MTKPKSNANWLAPAVCVNSSVMPDSSFVVPRPVRGIYEIKWHTPKQVQTYITTRIGGVSPAPYDSFNLANHVDNHPDCVKQNREILRTTLNLPSEPAWLNQTHSNKVMELTQPVATPLDADATFTTTPGLVCAVFSADCVPVLVTNKTGTLVAAIHAGWKGLANGVIANTIRALPDNPENCLAYVGPAICQACYEVGDDVKSQFDATFDTCFTPSQRAQHHLLNTQYIAELQLRQLGITDITISPDCTRCLPETYYSFRRDDKTGRMVALIWLI